MLPEIVTSRLLIRRIEARDLAELVRRRNQPGVARYQTWTLPYTMERAEQVLAKDDESETTWSGTIVEKESGVAVGDMVVFFSWEGRSAEIGYSLSEEYWGRGYAIEAAQSLVDYLFSRPEVHRVFATLHPDNQASAQVLERVGMIFEGHTRGSFWVGDENSDDWFYGMTREDWLQWQNRGPVEQVSLEPITPDTVFKVLRLRTHKTQESMVAPMAASFAEALYPEPYEGVPLVPWLRSVVADGEIVGFVMMAEVSETNPDPYLWRMLIDRLHQRRGIGGRVLGLLADEYSERGEQWIYVSWVPGRGSPEPFYLRHGFEATGEIIDDEVVARLHIGPGSGSLS